jgi:anti-anti-sigma factor
MSGIAFENHGTHGSIEFTQELTAMTWEQTEKVTQRIVQLIREDRLDDVVVTVPGFSSLPDGVLACLLKIWKSMNENSRRLVLVTECHSLITELEGSGMLKHWKVLPNREVALKFLRVSESTGETSVGNNGSTTSTSGSSVAMASSSSGSDPFRFEDSRHYCLLQYNSTLDRLAWSDQEAVSNTAIQRYEAAKSMNLMVDLSDVRYINSGGIAGLVRMYKAAKKKQGQFAVVSPNSNVTSALRTSGLAKVWHIAEDREEAAYSMGVSQSALNEHRERKLLLTVSLLFALIAALALIPMFLKRESVMGVNSQLAALLLGAVAATTGIIGILRESGRRRYLSVLSAVVAMLVLSTLWFRGNPISFRKSLEDFRRAVDSQTADDGSETEMPQK